MPFNSTCRTSKLVTVCKYALKNENSEYRVKVCNFCNFIYFCNFISFFTTPSCRNASCTISISPFRVKAAMQMLVITVSVDERYHRHKCCTKKLPSIQNQSCTCVLKYRAVIHCFPVYGNPAVYWAHKMCRGCVDVEYCSCSGW